MMGKQARVSKNDTLPGLGSIKQLRVILVILPSLSVWDIASLSQVREQGMSWEL